MKKELKIELQEELYQKLLNHFEGDEKTLKQFVIEYLKKMSTTERKPSSEKTLDAAGLRDYLQSSQPGSRGYGAKGQGW